MSYNIIILNYITKRNKPVELVWCEVILDKRKRHEKFFIKLTERITCKPMNKLLRRINNN